MEYKIFSQKVPKLDNKINIIVEYPEENEQYYNLLKYIKNYREETKILVRKDHAKVFINKEDILYYFSDNGHVYCKTMDDTYAVDSRMYKIEQENPDYIRLSRSHLINTNKIQKFNMSFGGKVVVVMEDGIKLQASRRKVSTIHNYLDERSI